MEIPSEACCTGQSTQIPCRAWSRASADDDRAACQSGARWCRKTSLLRTSAHKKTPPQGWLRASDGGRYKVRNCDPCRVKGIRQPFKSMACSYVFDLLVWCRVPTRNIIG